MRAKKKKKKKNADCVCANLLVRERRLRVCDKLRARGRELKQTGGGEIASEKEIRAGGISIVRPPTHEEATASHSGCNSRYNTRSTERKENKGRTDITPWILS